MERFWELLEESIILQGFITMVFAGSYCYLTVTGQQIPDGLDNMMWAVLAFWFGTKSQAAVSSTIKRLGNEKFSSNPGATAGDSDS